MAEHYVELVIEKVAKVCSRNNINEGKFWDWLGNVKFKGDNGNLTIERATFIGQNAPQLLNEYRELRKQDETLF